MAFIFFRDHFFNCQCLFGYLPECSVFISSYRIFKKSQNLVGIFIFKPLFLTVLKSSVAAIKTRFKRIEKKVFKKTHFVPYLYYFSCLFVDLASSKFLERKKHRETQRRKIPIWQHFFLIEFFFFPKLH
jgi:hypothetical protein